MIWDFTAMLRPLRRRRPEARGQVLRRAMRTAEGGRPVSRDDFWELFERPPAEIRGHAPAPREILRDGTPYEESGADEGDWRL